MKKILILTSRSYPSIGGVEKVVDQLASGLSVRGYKVRLLTNFFRTKKGGFGSLNEFIKQSFFQHLKAILGIGYLHNGYTVVETYFIFPGISFIRSLLSIFIFPISLLHFIFQVAIFKPDVINLHFADNSTVYGILCKFFFRKTTLISSLHGSDVVSFPSRSKIQHVLVNNLIKVSDNVVFVSKFLKDTADKVFSAATPNSVVIYNSTPKPIPVNNVARNENQILFVGRVVENKGVDILLEAFTRLNPKYPNLELVIVGDGDQLQSLKTKYEGNIKFLGFISDTTEIAKLYRSSVIFIAPSRFESFGKVALEAMSYGCAVVASDIGGFKEVIEDGKTGVLFKGENVESLGLTLAKLLDDSKLRESLVLNAIKSVDIKFSENIFLDNYENLIK